MVLAINGLLGSGKPKTSLLDRAVSNLSDTAHGFFPGMLEVGGSIAHDAARLGTGKTSGYALDNLVLGMAKGFNQSSFLPPLLSGHPIEALHRASARPFDALLDASLAFPAYRGAATAATRVGHATGNTGMLDWGLNAKGLVKAPPEMQGAIKSIERFKATGEIDNPNFINQYDLPATFEGPSGPLLTREWNPFAPNGGRMNLGDDIYINKSFRTLPMGMAHKVDAGGADDVMAEYKAKSDYENPTGTLGDDGFAASTMYRANDPLIARAGDAFFNKIGTSPIATKFLKPAGRIGSHLTRYEALKTRTENDSNYIATQKLMGEYRDDMRASNPEVFGHMDDAELNDVIAKEGFRRAFDVDLEGIDGVINRMDPASPYAGMTAEELFRMSPAEARDQGFFIEPTSPDVDWSDDAYGSYNSFQELLDDNHERLNRHDPDTGDFAPELKLRVESSNHRQARLDALRARQAAADELGRTLSRATSYGHVPHLVKDNTPEPLINLAGRDMSDIIDRMVDDPDTQLIFQRSDNLEQLANLRNQTRFEGMDMDGIDELHLLEQEGSRKELARAIGEYKKYKGERKNYDEISKHYLNYNELKNGKFVNDTTTSDPGIITKLSDLRDAQALPHIPRDSEAAKNFFSQVDSMVGKGAKYWKESLNGMMDDARVQQNVGRGADMLHGPGYVPETASFYPMIKESFGESGNVKGSRYERDSAPEIRRLDQSPGDPHALMLSGDFRVDSDVISDYFRKSRETVGGERILQAVKGMAREVSPEEADQLLKSPHVGTSEDFLAGKDVPNFIVVRRDDFVNQASGELVDQLRDAKNAVLAHNDPNAEAVAGDIQKAMDNLARLEIGNPDVAVAERAMDVGVKTQAAPQNLHVVPTDLYRGVLKELTGAQASIGSWYHSVQNGWKFMVLHTRFAGWMRNNVIGAHLMAAMSRGPLNYLEHMSKLADPKYKAAFDAFDDPRNADVLQTGSASLARSNAKMTTDPDSLSTFDKKMLGVKGVQNKLSDINAQWADDPMRKFHMMDQMHDQVKLMEESLGTKIEVTPELVERFLSDEGLRSEMARRTGVDLVNFADLGFKERKWLASIFPFYSWMKGSSKAAQRLISDKPGAVYAASLVGEEGNKATHDDHGRFIPEFAKDMWDPGQPGGMSINTAGFLPYQTPIDLASMLAGTVPDFVPGDYKMGMHYNQYGGENLISNMNPLIGGAFQAMTGKNAYFGTPLPNNSLGSNFLNMTVTGLPPYKLADMLIRNNTSPTATSETSRGMTLAQWLGVPIKDPRWGQLHQRGVDELNERYKNPAAVNELVPIERR